MLPRHAFPNRPVGGRCLGLGDPRTDGQHAHPTPATEITLVGENTVAIALSEDRTIQFFSMTRLTVHKRNRIQIT